MYTKISVIAFLFLLTNVVQAQQICNCEEFDKPTKAEYDKYFRVAELDIPKKIAGDLEQSTDNCCKAKAQILFANIHLREQQLDSVLFRVGKAKAFLGKQYDSLVSPEQYRLKGMVAATLQKPDSAIYYYLEGLKNSEFHKNLKYQIIFCNQVSQTFASVNQPEQGLKYMKLSLELALEKKDNDLISMAYSNLASDYGMMYEITKNKKYLDSMKVLAPKSLEYAKLTSNPYYAIKSYNLLAGLELEYKQYARCIAYCDTVLELTPPQGMDQLRISALLRKGQSLSALGKHETGITNLQQGLALAKPFGVEKITLAFYEQLYLSYKDYGKPEEALNYFEIFKTKNDSLTNIEKTTVINDLEQQYNKAKNEQTIKELHQQDEISSLKIRFLIAGIAIALLVALSIWLYYRQKNLKHQQTILETEQRLNRARMNPHFFFNALTALQSFALRENDGKQLASNLSKFSHIMRETLESTYKDYVTIEQEVDFLREYLELQKIRFPYKFNYNLDLVKDFEIESLMVPSMIIQPFVENAIEHGFSGIDYMGELNVLFDEQADNVVITVIDNGKGLMATRKESTEHISRASQIIKDRIYLLNIKLKTKASFSIDNNVNGAGVTVKIYLPKIDKHESANN